MCILLYDGHENLCVRYKHVYNSMTVLIINDPTYSLHYKFQAVRDISQDSSEDNEETTSVKTVSIIVAQRCQHVENKQK